LATARIRANHEYFAPLIHGSVSGTVVSGPLTDVLSQTTAFSANVLLVESSNS
jgi:hypothetical protein